MPAKGQREGVQGRPGHLGSARLASPGRAVQGRLLDLGVGGRPVGPVDTSRLCPGRGCRVGRGAWGRRDGQRSLRGRCRVGSLTWGVVCWGAVSRFFPLSMGLAAMGRQNLGREGLPAELPPRAPCRACVQGTFTSRKVLEKGGSRLLGVG